MKKPIVVLPCPNVKFFVEHRFTAPSGLFARPLILALILLVFCLSAPAVERYVSPTGGHVPPFTSWSDAATNIQDAIDACSDGDVVWVTNGVYATGGKVMAGDLTNRVALDKAVTVRSVNGPVQTIIQAAWDPATTNGIGAERCAWLTNGAILSGFTLRGGATRTAGDPINLQSGGGAWCSSTNAVLAQCRIVGNSAMLLGGGVYSGTVKSSWIFGNNAATGGGAAYGSLNNSTITGNIGRSGPGGTFATSAVNSIIQGNGTPSGSTNNYTGGSFLYCCTTPLPTGAGNLGADPQLMPDHLHLPETSPCRNAGTNSVSGAADIDGQPWNDPPSIGCDEWLPDPIIAAQPRFTLGTQERTLAFSVLMAGQGPFACAWSRDGTPLEEGLHYSQVTTTNLLLHNFSLSDAGAYQVVVSNAFGTTTSGVFQLMIHCVDAQATNPVVPYTNWSTATATIQDAIDAAQPDEIVLVTNGVYSTGGRVMAGDLTNRVALDKPILVQSVNGARATLIEGAWYPVWTNGITAVRCAWLTDEAMLSGFTLQGGATRSSGDTLTQRSGGGAWCAGSDAVIAHCRITGNAASYYGGGVYKGLLNRCEIVANTATVAGGGTYGGTLNSCLVSSNAVPAGTSGGGAYGGTLNHCTVIRNASNAAGGGTAYCRATNCIIYFNSAVVGGVAAQNCYLTTNLYTCTDPVPPPYSPPGVSNITSDPLLFDEAGHLSNLSPCRNSGTNSAAFDVDLAGNPWANPPSMGCYEWQSIPLAGAASMVLTSDPVGFNLSATASGQEPLSYWWIKDGFSLTEDGHYDSTQTTNLTASGVGLSDAGAYQLVVSNAYGMATSTVVQVVVHCVDASGTNPIPPYSSWETATTSIQNAIDVAQSGEIVLVTNGVYASGGKTMSGDLTNRVALDKPLLVQSVNGPAVTIIDGLSPANGPAAIRCAWLTNGATLSGFTLRSGATRTVTVSPNEDMNGGGVWGVSTDASVVGCVITNNSAGYMGGGACRVTLLDCRVIDNQAVGSGAAGSGVAGAGTGGGAIDSNLRNCILDGNLALQSNAGGAQNCNLRNCLLTRNSSYLHGGAAYLGTLVNCTVSENISGGYGAYGAAVESASLTNCVVYYNTVRPFNLSSNHYDCTFTWSCTAPLPAGQGNIADDPKLLPDGCHLATNSPCLGAGTNSVVNGTDIDGQAWGNPPSMGCDEWHPAPVYLRQPGFRLGPQYGALTVEASFAGQAPFTCFWSKDGDPIISGAHYSGADTASLQVQNFGPADAGDYRVVVSNAFGVATSEVAQLVIHCVDAAQSAASSPFLDWATAATNIQDAIAIAAPGDFVLVTNGVYADGGIAVDGVITNRVALYKPVTVASVNGPSATTIQGAWDPVSTNGPLAVRCAWVTSGATLSGFTLTRGATRAIAAPASLGQGGGVWCPSISDAVVENCLLVSNSAYVGGGGSRWGALRNCAIVQNRVTASYGYAGGALGGTLVNCTVAWNYAPNFGGGQQDATLTNCIVHANWTSGMAAYMDNAGGLFVYSCSPNLTPGVAGNISSMPQFMDAYHLAVTSPCRGAGTNVASGADLDGEAWDIPPSIGCDEVWESAITGPLSVSLLPDFRLSTNVVHGQILALYGGVTGRASRVSWDFGDGSILTNVSVLNTWHVWTNAGDYTVTFTAFNADHSEGVATNLLIHVLQLEAPAISTSGLSGTNFSLSFSGQPGVTYVVEQATNLVPPVIWEAVSTVSSTGSVMQVIDTEATNTMRFYRVRVP